jgi:hypothetical protein
MKNSLVNVVQSLDEKISGIEANGQKASEATVVWLGSIGSREATPEEVQQQVEALSAIRRGDA